jgi:hypothetical protein
MTYDFDRLASELPELELPDSVRHRHLAALALLTQPPAAPVRPVRRLRRVGVTVGVSAFAAAAIGVGVAASTGAFDSPVGNHNTAHCYTTTELGRSDNHNDFGVAVSAGDPHATGDAAAQAMDICSNQWAIGRFSTTTPTFPDYASGPATHPVPVLTACVLDNGEVAIFPGTPKTCISLGLGNTTF